MFRFGGGTKRQSIGTYTLPCNVGGKDVSLTVDVVEQEDLPCLLSQESMRKAKAVIDFDQNQVELFGRKVVMTSGPSGHPVIQLMPYIGDGMGDQHEVLWQTLDGKDWNEDFKKMM